MYLEKEIEQIKLRNKNRKWNTKKSTSHILKTTEDKVDDKDKENLLDQNFKADKPSEKWVGDITYIYTKETGWTYLAIVMDLYDLKIIGWSYGKNMTSELVISAFEKAKVARGVTKGMIFHSDLGSQYTSNEYENLLVKNKVKHSYSKKGYPYYNPRMESFNAI